jgi:hypothetical protein
MKNFYTFGSLVSMIVLLLVACAPSAQSNAADQFAGTWAGLMSFTDRDTMEDVFITIPSGCAVGEVCGEIFNSVVNCTWEVHLEAVKVNFFEYTFSKTLSGECPAMGNGTLTLQADGTLVREHITPNFTSTGTLGRQAEGYEPMYGFAGLWSGQIIASDNPDSKTDIEISIPTACKIGNTCGNFDNLSGLCGINMIMKTNDNNVLNYEFSSGSTEQCAYTPGAGSLTLQADGTLLWEHTSLELTASAVLTRK